MYDSEQYINYLESVLQPINAMNMDLFFDNEVLNTVLTDKRSEQIFLRDLNNALKFKTKRVNFMDNPLIGKLHDDIVILNLVKDKNLLITTNLDLCTKMVYTKIGEGTLKEEKYMTFDDVKRYDTTNLRTFNIGDIIPFIDINNFINIMNNFLNKIVCKRSWHKYLTNIWHNTFDDLSIIRTCPEIPKESDLKKLREAYQIEDYKQILHVWDNQILMCYPVEEIQNGIVISSEIATSLLNLRTGEETELRRDKTASEVEDSLIIYDNCFYFGNNAYFMNSDGSYTFLKHFELPKRAYTITTVHLQTESEFRLQQGALSKLKTLEEPIKEIEKTEPEDPEMIKKKQEILEEYQALKAKIDALSKEVIKDTEQTTTEDTSLKKLERTQI